MLSGHLVWEPEHLSGRQGMQRVHDSQSLPGEMRHCCHGVAGDDGSCLLLVQGYLMGPAAHRWTEAERCRVKGVRQQHECRCCSCPCPG